jgi:hypothetical protein
MRTEQNIPRKRTRTGRVNKIARNITESRTAVKKTIKIFSNNDSGSRPKSRNGNPLGEREDAADASRRAR